MMRRMSTIVNLHSAPNIHGKTVPVPFTKVVSLPQTGRRGRKRRRRRRGGRRRRTTTTRKREEKEKERWWWGWGWGWGGRRGRGGRNKPELLTAPYIVGDSHGHPIAQQKSLRGRNRPELPDSTIYYRRLPPHCRLEVVGRKKQTS